jgi:hypothetical protein
MDSMLNCGSGPLLVHRVIQKKEIEYSFSAMIETRSFANKKGKEDVLV